MCGDGWGRARITTYVPGTKGKKPRRRKRRGRRERERERKKAQKEREAVRAIEIDTWGVSASVQIGCRGIWKETSHLREFQVVGTHRYTWMGGEVVLGDDDDHHLL